MEAGVLIVVITTRKLSGKQIVGVYVMTECNCGKNEIIRVYTNCLAKTEFGFEPKIKLKEGLEKTIEWYIEKIN